MSNKMNIKDFHIDDDLIPDRQTTTAAITKATSEARAGAADVTSTTKTTNKQKSSKVKLTPLDADSPAITVRLAFNKDEYKSLLSLALMETEKSGRRCSVTNLIYQHLNKLIKKGYTNA